MKAIILAAGSGERFKNAGVQTPKPLVKLGGLSLLERTIRTAWKAGSEEILVVIGSEASTIQNTLSPRLSSLPIRWVINEKWQSGNGTSMLAAMPHLQGSPALVLMADHLVFAGTLRRFLAERGTQNQTTMAIDFKTTLLSDPDDATKVAVSGDRITAVNKALTQFQAYDTGISICCADYFELLVQAAQNQGGACAHSDGMRQLASRGRLFAWDIGDDRWEDVDTPEAFKAGEKLVMLSLRKSTDGFMSKHVERHLSGWVTRRVMNWPVTPNHLTVAVVGIGFFAAYLFSQPGYWTKVAGAVVFWCASFLDGCDGEIARLKFLESRLGGWLDLWSDNIVHMAVFFGIGVGLWRDLQDPQWIGLGVIAALGVLFSVSIVSYRTAQKKKTDGPLYTSVSNRSDSLTKLADALSRRDFIFGSIFIAFLQWLPEFLWAAAIGSHLYWIVLVLAGIRAKWTRV